MPRLSDFFIPQDAEQTVPGLGHRLRVRSNGIIVTNQHVVAGAENDRGDPGRRDRRARRAAGRGSGDRHRGPAGAAQGPARGGDRRERRPHDRRVGARPRQSIRLLPRQHRADRHRGSGERDRRATSSPAEGPGRPLPRHDPDRCGHQSRQLRRAAGQRAGRGGGRQLVDLLQERRVRWARLRHPDRARGPGGRRDHPPGLGPAGLDRARRWRARSRWRTGSRRGAGWSRAWRRAAPPTGPGSSRATSSSRPTAASCGTISTGKRSRSTSAWATPSGPRSGPAAGGSR